MNNMTYIVTIVNIDTKQGTVFVTKSYEAADEHISINANDDDIVIVNDIENDI